MAQQDTTGWLDNARLDVVPAGGGGSGSSGFTLSIEDAESMLATLDQILEDLPKVLGKAWRLDQVPPPAQEPASLGYQEKLTSGTGQPGAFSYGLGHIELEREFLLELRSRLATALGRKESADEEAGGKIPGPADDEGGLF